jgi:hypothetical protein
MVGATGSGRLDLKHRIAKSIAVAAVLAGVCAPSAFAAFGVDDNNFVAEVRKSHTPGELETRAGATPVDGVTDFTFNTTGALGVDIAPDENVRNIRVDLPPGLISNPQATPLCDKSEPSDDPTTCPDNTKIGKVALTVAAVGMLSTINADVYNIQPRAGQVSLFSFQTTAGRTDIVGGVRDTTDYGLFFTITDVPQVANIVRSVLTFYGVPQDQNGAGGTRAPFIRLPTACLGVQTTKLTVTSWQGHTDTAEDTTPVGAQDCPAIPFQPQIAVKPSSTQRDAPVGATVDIAVPWEDDPDKPASSHVKTAVVTLPPGMTISPSAANGLEACSDDQFGQGTHNTIACPAASKVGTAEIQTPVLGDSLKGSVYLGRPLADNPYRLFVVADGFGLSVRLKGTVTPDPVTGQLKTTFADTPQVPFSHFILKLNPGPNATLASPLQCGDAATTSAITPYSGNADATPGSSYTVDLDGNGTPCPPTPFNLGFTAGTSNLLAGAFTPFSLTVSRDDGQQFLGGLTVTQPPGLLGVIQSVPLCDEALAAAGTCPEASRVGTSTVASGPGSAPFSLSGPVYLAGPYGGGPVSLVIAIRAIAGPFDLGTVVVRAAIKVDPSDSHLTIETPSLPTILQGIPLRLRSVNVSIDRASFLFNATNCDAHAVGATLKSSDGATQDVSAPYQPTGCDGLPYAPKMTAVTSAAKRGAPAGLTVNLSQAPGEANTKSVSVKLPSQLGARLSTINLACPEATFKADPKTCAAGSKVGTVSAVTPVLAQPLGGTVYLAAHRPPNLPTLEAVLEGSGITVDLSGKLNLSNGITSTFDTVPDVPITSFKLALPPSASNSALQATADLCAAPLPLIATINGQNGKKVDVNSVVEVSGCGVQITRAFVKKRTATLSVRVPAPGAVTISGKGLKKVKKSYAKAGTYKIRTKLTKKGVKALRKALKAKRKSKRKLLVKTTAVYAPKKGSVVGGEAVKASRASKKLTFKK